LWADVLTAHDEAWLAKMDDVGFRAAMVTKSDLSIASLAVILIGLIVLWTGYIKRSRPAWFVMCVVVWFWAYPVFISAEANLRQQASREASLSAVIRPQGVLDYNRHCINDLPTTSPHGSHFDTIEKIWEFQRI